MPEMVPTAILASSGFTSPDVGDVQDDPEAGDSEWLGATLPFSIRFGFGTPGVLAGTQTVKVLVRAPNDPFVTVSLYEAGALVRALDARTVTATAGQVITATFAASELDDPADAEIVVAGVASGPVELIPPDDYGYEPYNEGPFAAGTLVDATGSSWIEDNDDSDGDSNPWTARVTDTTNVVFRGGTIHGNIDMVSAWEDVYALGNTVGVFLEDCPGGTLERWRITNAWDGLLMDWNCANWTIRECWVTGARDDAIENDRVQSGSVIDCLFEDTAAGISLDPSSGSPVDGSANTVVVDGMLLKLKAYLYEGNVVHFSPIKTDSLTLGAVTPNLEFRNCVIAITQVDHDSYRSTADLWVHMTESENNHYLNLTDTALPGDYPIPPGGWSGSGWTYLAGAPARAFWDAARANWIAAHAHIFG